MRRLSKIARLAMLIAAAAMPASAEDIGKKACMADAKRLCPAQVKAMDRKGAEACLYQKINETTPHCHETILLIREQRAQAAKSPSNKQ